ncbi:MAG: hypothetical protein LQ338_001571 [Usnochroma carphineum]|nr:MAG: hypothetical protein LQ338_001571 [Usnochroma carphineum]
MSSGFTSVNVPRKDDAVSLNQANSPRSLKKFVPSSPNSDSRTVAGSPPGKKKQRKIEKRTSANISRPDSSAGLQTHANTQGSQSHRLMPGRKVSSSTNQERHVLDVPQKSPSHKKRKHEDKNASTNHQSESPPSKRAKRSTSVHGKGNTKEATRTKVNRSATSTPPPPAPSPDQVPTHRPISQEQSRDSSKSPKSARLRKASEHGSRSKEEAAAKFEAVHIPNPIQLDSAAARHLSNPGRASIHPRRHQPVREVKILPSIEEQVHRNGSKDPPYGWDEPVVYDARYLQQCAKDNILNGVGRDSSPARERDESFVPTNSATVTDVESTPPNRRRKSRKWTLEDDGQPESSAAAERRANSTHNREILFSPAARFKRELTAAVESASMHLDGNDEIIPISERDFHIAQNGEMRRRIGWLRMLIQKEREMNAALRTDCESLVERAKGILDRVLAAKSAGLLTSPGPVHDARPHEAAANAHLANVAQSMEISGQTSKRKRHSHAPSTPELQNSSCSAPSAVNTTEGSNSPRSLQYAKALPQDQTDTRGRSAKRNERGKGKRPARFRSHPRPAPPDGRSLAMESLPGSSVSGTPSLPKRPRARSKTTHSKKGPSTHPAPTPGKRKSDLTAAKDLQRAYTTPVHSRDFVPDKSERSRPGSTGQPEACGDALGTSAKETIVAHVAGRGGTSGAFTEHTLQEPKGQMIQMNILAKPRMVEGRVCRDKGKGKGVDCYNNGTAYDPRHLYQGAQGDGKNEAISDHSNRPKNSRSGKKSIDETAHGSREEAKSLRRETTELPDVESIRCRYAVASETSTTRSRARRQAVPKDSNAIFCKAVTLPPRRSVTISESSISGASSAGSASAATDSPRAATTGEEPPSKRARHETSARQEVQLAFPSAAKGQSENSASLNQARGEQKSEKALSSPADYRLPKCTTATTARPEALPSSHTRLGSRVERTVQVQYRGAGKMPRLHRSRQNQGGRGAKQENKQLPHRHELNSNRSLREITMPLSTIQQWDHQCRCVEHPEYFLDHVRPSLETWPAGKEQLLFHCQQIMECPAHPELTKRTCRDIYNVEWPLFQEELRQSGQPWQEVQLANEVSSTYNKDIEEAIASAIAFLGERADNYSQGRQTDGRQQRGQSMIQTHVFYRKDAPRPQSRQLPDPPSPIEAVDTDEKPKGARPAAADLESSVEGCSSHPLAHPLASKGKFKKMPGHLGSGIRAWRPSPDLPTPDSSPPPTWPKIPKSAESKDADAGPQRTSVSTPPDSPPTAQASSPSPAQSIAAKSVEQATATDKGLDPDNIFPDYTESRKSKGRNALTGQSTSAPSLIRQRTDQCYSRPQNGFSSDPSSHSQDRPRPTVEHVTTPEQHAKSVFRRHDTEPLSTTRFMSPATVAIEARRKLHKLPLFARHEAILNQRPEPSSRTTFGQTASTHASNFSAATSGQEDARSKATPTLERSKLSKHIPHAERTTDEELIRIGRYSSPHVRHEAAPYAFRQNGKLFVEYHYLLGRKDVYGEGWSDVLKRKLTSK